ncbi:GDSL-type esterase/lipase family protein [Kribbella sp. NBC_01245]|uniref:GDSL-type esterase/lipase family protein n=1 Tax=Kribbella sp. NBC_01245 TaxID=2903578 RepID=UPI002E2DFCBA|nr:GDSL-type esterase/lipase family protein [Kribbella sp. NBC_01245]
MELRSSFIAATVIACSAVMLPAAPASAAPTRYEAESAPATCSGTIDTDHAGYSGTGFCNGANAVGAAAQFTVNATTSGTATVGIRFASGTTTARPADVIVNGSRVSATTFEGTGTWSSWSTKTLAVQVNAGSNTIGLSPTTAAGLPNVDYVEFEVTAGGSPGTGRLDDPNLQYYGRWNRSNSSFYTMGWAGGYVDARFTGSSIGVRQRNAIDLFYSIDGGSLRWRRNVSGNVTLATGLATGSHSVRIGYRERAGSYNGDAGFGGLILAGGGQTAPVARPQNLVEFIGDSITVGQPNADRPFVAYPWRAGEALGAGHTQVAEGGACLVSRDCVGMMDWFRRSTSRATTDDWNFSTYQATGVVINLGTNDVGHGVSAAQFQQGYVVLLERVRRAYPNAHIFAMQTFRNRYVPETRNAVAARTAAGDSKVHFVDTTGWINTTTDLVDAVHPSPTGHAKIAQRLAPILDQYL